MKIYVIGTSNSVMRNGWVFGLKHNKNLEVINLSVGRTPSLMHLSKVMLHSKELKEADLIIIDHIINDINYYIPKIGDSYHKYIKDFYILISSLGVPILNLIFPIYNLGNRENGIKNLEKIVELCKQFSIYYINFNTLNLSFDYYEDDVHLRAELAYFIGLELSKVLLQNSLEVSNIMLPFFKTSKTTFLIPSSYDTDCNSSPPLKSKLLM